MREVKMSTLWKLSLVYLIMCVDRVLVKLEK
jgi:hypothetical protein